MERRVLIAVILSFLVLYGYQALFPPPPDQTGQQKPAQASKTATAPNASAAERGNPAPSVQPSQPLPAESGAQPVAAREVVIDDAEVRGVFTSRGGVLKS